MCVYAQRCAWICVCMYVGVTGQYYPSGPLMELYQADQIGWLESELPVIHLSAPPIVLLSLGL